MKIEEYTYCVEDDRTDLGRKRKGARRTERGEEEELCELQASCSPEYLAGQTRLVSLRRRHSALASMSLDLFFHSKWKSAVRSHSASTPALPSSRQTLFSRADLHPAKSLELEVAAI